jgi:hypothetical protein
MEFGLVERDFPAIVAKAQKSSSMKGNPIKLSDDELLEILKKACRKSAENRSYIRINRSYESRSSLR